MRLESEPPVVFTEWPCRRMLSLQVVSVDCNPAQSALLELKAVAIKQLEFEDVWQVGMRLAPVCCHLRCFACAMGHSCSWCKHAEVISSSGPSGH